MAFGDLHIEKLIYEIKNKNIPILEANIHRACIDLNRKINEIDPKKIKGKWNKEYSITNYVEDDFGLIPLRLGMPHKLTKIYNQSSLPDANEINKRINRYYSPYHNKLSALINQANKTFGVSVHLNMHSFDRSDSNDLDDIIIGNLSNKTANPEFSNFIANFFQKEGFSVSFNSPFKGAALISKHSNLKQEKHSIQIEIARDLYMNTKTLKMDPVKGKKLQKTLNELAEELHKYTISYAAKLKGCSNTFSQDSFKDSSNSLRPN
jgi:N-formylglutamate deformylase